MSTAENLTQAFAGETHRIQAADEFPHVPDATRVVEFRAPRMVGVDTRPLAQGHRLQQGPRFVAASVAAMQRSGPTDSRLAFR